MTKPIYATAKRLAPRFAIKDGRIQNWDAMRDYADLATGGDFDCVELDLVTDSMWRMLHLGAAAEIAPPQRLAHPTPGDSPCKG